MPLYYLPSYFKPLISLFFWLDPKEPKGQDTAKLQPHLAGRWLAAVSAPAPTQTKFSIQKSYFNLNIIKKNLGLKKSCYLSFFLIPNDI
jgi:hypothetical protein